MANFRVRHLPGAIATSARCPLPGDLALRSPVTRDSKNSPIDSFMTNFHLGCSIRTRERHRSRLSLTNCDPRGTFEENEKIISPIEYLMANLRRKAAVEPTALALLALPSTSVRERERAIRFLLQIQNPNGSWPAFLGDGPEGSGFTGLVVYALTRSATGGTATDRAIRWLLQSRGWESHWFWKWKFRTTDRHGRFSPDKFGCP